MATDYKTSDDMLNHQDCVTLIESSQAVDVREKFPAVLEYLPYRKADWTAERDHRRHPWLASHGFVVVRADIRGAGDSDGLYHDEYLQQEMDDCCHLIGKINTTNTTTTTIMITLSCRLDIKAELVQWTCWDVR